MIFPVFDGSNPQLWLTRAKSYFEMYSVHQSMWLRVSTHHFTEAAARWLQSVESQLAHISWDSFAPMILERFNRDQHESLLRQHFRIHMTSSVVDYVDRYVALAEQLSAYHPKIDQRTLATRFVDGLADPIRQIVMMQRPSDLDNACSLALLQEEAQGTPRPKEVMKPKFYSHSKHQPPRTGLPLPLPPAAPVVVGEKRDEDRRPRGPSVDDKLSTLRAYRKAQGLCMRCGEKWAPGHRCGPQI